MKIIDQTKRTINKLEGKSKRRRIPGTDIFNTHPRQTKKQPGPSRENSPFRSNTQNGFPDLSKLDSPVSHTMTNDDGVSLVFYKELESLMKPAKSYGIDGIEDSNDSVFEEEQDQKWMDELLRTILTESAAFNGRKDSFEKVTYEYGTDQLHCEFRLVNHYCHVMSRFYSVKEPEWNFYSVVSNHFAHRYTPLRHSILAWSSLHLAITENTSTSVSKRYFHNALLSVMKENFLDSSVPVELLLATSFFLCLYDIMAGSSNIVHILRYVWSTLRVGMLFEGNPEQYSSGKSKMSAFAYQLVTWLMYLDIRSALFIGNINFPNYIMLEERNNSKTPESRDVEYLTVSDMYEFKTVLNIFRNSRNVLSDFYGLAYPKKNLATDDIQDNILVLMVKNMMLFGTLIRLRNWLELCGNSTEFEILSLESKIDGLYQETQRLQHLDPMDNLTRFHVCIINALMHSSIIYFDRICHPDIITNEKCQKSASEILKIAVELKEHRFHNTPGSFHWPFPLFVAGIETTDVVYQKWILDELETCAKEGWGLHLRQTKILLEECLKKQKNLGQRVDVGPVMHDITGYFVL